MSVRGPASTRWVAEQRSGTLCIVGVHELSGRPKTSCSCAYESGGGAEHDGAVWLSLEP